MIINLPNNGTIDTSNITNDFEEIVKKSFAGFTEGTAKDYRYQDKLLYLDLVRKKFHKYINSYDAVKEVLMSRFEYELDEYGEIPSEDDFYNMEFMETCFDAGFMPMYDTYSATSSSENERIMKVLADIVKIVINYEDSK